MKNQVLQGIFGKDFSAPVSKAEKKAGVEEDGRLLRLTKRGLMV
jgi:hypothetical protein